MNGPYRDPTLNELREKYEKRIAELTEALQSIVAVASDFLTAHSEDPVVIIDAIARAALKEDT